MTKAKQPKFAIKSVLERADLKEMTALLAQLQGVVGQLEAAIAAQSDPSLGLREPYGPPIMDAAVSGDLARMKATAEAARRALYQVEFKPVAKHKAARVASALDQLETQIRKLEGK